MAVNTSRDTITITDNTVEQIRGIDDGQNFGIWRRVKSNNPKQDVLIPFSPTEFRDLVNWGRDRLYERFK